MAETKKISTDELNVLTEQREGHFFDFKGKQIMPSRLSKTISAFANASGGELVVGIEEIEGLSGTERQWHGFADEEAANGVLQVLHDLGSGLIANR